MAEKKVTTTTTQSETTDVLHKAKGFWENYSKPIIYVGGAIILAIAAWYGYQNFIVAPKEKKASELIFPAENLFDKMAASGFNKDSVNITLNGGMNNGMKVTGLLKIISSYGGTDAANRASYMTGASYLQIKEFDKAIKYLKEFDANGATQLENRANLMLGHAYAEKKQTSDALKFYKKAASVNEKDEIFTADALLIAAGYADVTGQSKDAIELYQRLKDKYPSHTSVQSGEVDKYLARLGITK
ncbi:MAG TPA: tetratricopeptide repeat protein [Ferruginibacter sp.]|nr:tetratricopeptide repeat protein [Ferruginibacter sp.]